MTAFRTDGPAEGRRIVLAHGAGAAMDSPFLERVASGLADRGLRVFRFEFPYMAARREGRRPGPDRQPVLVDSWRRVIDELGDPGSLVIGGKSLGGRIATLVADETGVAGLVCLGYPFHPPGKPDRVRTAHLERLATPTLVLQGTRDPLGSEVDVAGYTLSKKIRVLWLEDGDHSFKPRKKSGRTEDEHLERTVAEVAGFVGRL